MGAVVITQPGDRTQSWLLQTVEKQAQQSAIKMPEVAIFDSADVNAFATGMNKNAALVAVSSGLLANMQQNEVEAVLAHEISHIANGDMVTLALVQGIVNTFVIFFSRVVGHVVDRVVFKTQRGYGPAYYITSIVAQIFFGILASSIVMYFSRRREFRADAGAAHLAGTEKMIAALQRLQNIHRPAHMPDQLAAFGINASVSNGLRKLFMSHPPLEERIAALKALS